MRRAERFEGYVAAVLGHLRAGAEHVQSIRSDLTEHVMAGRAGGLADAEISRRLGTPREVAEAYSAEMGIPLRPAGSDRRRRIRTIAAAGAAVVLAGAVLYGTLPPALTPGDVSVQAKLIDTPDAPGVDSQAATFPYVLEVAVHTEDGRPLGGPDYKTEIYPFLDNAAEFSLDTGAGQPTLPGLTYGDNGSSLHQAELALLRVGIGVANPLRSVDGASYIGDRHRLELRFGYFNTPADPSLRPDRDRVVVVFTESLAGRTLSWTKVVPVHIDGATGSGPWGYIRGGVWAASGDEVAYQAPGGVVLSHLGAKPKRQMLLGATAQAATWSPDGRTLTLVSSQNPAFIYAFGRNGRPLWSGSATGGAFGAAPEDLVWSPDGRYLAAAGSGELTLFGQHSVRVVHCGAPVLWAAQGDALYCVANNAVGEAQAPMGALRPLPGTGGATPDLYAGGLLYLAVPAGGGWDVGIWNGDRLSLHPLPQEIRPFATSLTVLATAQGLLATTIGQAGMPPELWVYRIASGKVRYRSQNPVYLAGFVGSRLVYSAELGSGQALFSTSIGSWAVKSHPMLGTGWQVEPNGRIAYIRMTGSGPELVESGAGLGHAVSLAPLH